MIKRIVRLSFKHDNVADFMKIFNESKLHIASFPGCRSLILLHDDSQRNILFTISEWDNTDALENYRKSELFNKTWKQTKILFNEKPLAWSTITIETVK
ncbi:MAG: putative quinol monooxygenase [Bacteroidota bacterium]|jgi:quinol monooxygenase YgiN